MSPAVALSAEAHAAGPIAAQATTASLPPKTTRRTHRTLMPIPCRIGYTLCKIYAHIGRSAGRLILPGPPTSETRGGTTSRSRAQRPSVPRAEPNHSFGRWGTRPTLGCQRADLAERAVAAADPR